MGYRVVRRPVREVPAAPRPEIRTLAAPPPAPAPAGAGRTAAQVLLPAMGGLGTVLFLVANGNPVFLLAGAVMLVGMVGGAAAMLLGQRTGARRQARMLRERYAAHVEEEREVLRAAGRQQSEHAARIHPHPGALAALVEIPGRLWERRPADPDFLQLRVGLGTVPRAVRVVLPTPSSPLEVSDPICRRAGELLVRAHGGLPRQPVVVPAGEAGTVTVVGHAEGARHVARLLIAQLTSLHAPGELRLAICCPPSAVSLWSWCKWLPHCYDNASSDGVAPRRLAAGSLPELRAELDRELSARLEEAAHARRLGGRPAPRQRIVVLVDETVGPQAGDLDPGEPGVSLTQLGVSVVRLVASREAEPGQVDVRVEVAGEAVTVERLGSEPDTVTGVLDEFGIAEAEALARALAPLRLEVEPTLGEPMTATTELPRLLEVDDPAGYNVHDLWRRREPRDFLRVPIGVCGDGRPLILDLKEAAHGGMGPHGLCVGATGSGKSELLRTLVLALAMTHPPERLSLLLVDYKGGATFAGMERLPHTAGLITNLSDDLGLVDRMHDALFGELRRRQQVLLRAGNVPDITDYDRRRSQGQPLPALPNLLVVVDEFAELLTARPDFIDLFIAVGRIGRSIGVHQLLASQRLEEGRLRGLEASLSYRIALRTFNAEESRAVLGVPDAFELPPLPGSGFLKVDTTVFERFKAAYVSGPAQQRSAALPPAAPTCEPFELFNRQPLAELEAAGSRDGAPHPADAAARPAGESLLDLVVARLAEAGEESGEGVRQIWLPPLPGLLPLDAVTGPPVEQRERGLRLTDPQLGRLRIPVGLLDLPAEQEQEPFVLDLSGSTGHLAILGAPQTGKSGLLRTLITAAALTHAPGEVAFYCLDLGGGTLGPLAELPHVGTVCPRSDADRIRRTVHEVQGLLEERERVFAGHGIDAVETMRRLWRSGSLPELPFADVFLVVDNYPALRSDHEDAADLLTDIATRGLAYGVHLVLTAPRWHDLRPALQTAIGGRVELHLADPLDSVIDRKLAANISARQPGRCLSDRALLGQVALPRVDSRPRSTTCRRR